MQPYLPKRLIFAFIALWVIFFIGTVGYIYIEKWTFLEAFFMTVITLTTVGFSEVRPLSTAGRIFTIFLLLSGFGVLTYVVTSGISFLLAGELGNLMRRRKMEKQIQNLKNHFIICTTGETGEYVIEEFIKTEQECVVVTTDSVLSEKLLNKVNIILGSPTEDRILEKAGIKVAKGLISCLEDDKLNLFVVLTAKGLNPDLRIVTQAIEKGSIAKLRKAGADEVVSTTAIGGMRIASAMLRPTVVSFLDTMLYESVESLRVEEATISDTSPIKDNSLAESNITEKTGLIVVAIKEKQTGKYIYNPKGDYKLKTGDTLIVIGNSKQVKNLRRITEP